MWRREWLTYPKNHLISDVIAWKTHWEEYQRVKKSQDEKHVQIIYHAAKSRQTEQECLYNLDRNTSI